MICDLNDDDDDDDDNDGDDDDDDDDDNDNDDNDDNDDSDDSDDDDDNDNDDDNDDDDDGRWVIVPKSAAIRLSPRKSSKHIIFGGLVLLCNLHIASQSSLTQHSLP